MTDNIEDKGISSAHDETNSFDLPPTGHKFKFSTRAKRQDGDVALALFANADELNEAIDPQEEKKLIRKIDLVILPLIAVNYAFFYIGTYRRFLFQYCARTRNGSLTIRHNIDKTTLSYAAIFGIREDLNLHGTQYSWLSSKI